MKTKNLALAIVMILAITMPLSALSGVMAQPTGSISLSTPPSGLSVGSTFTVTASISGSTNVWQWVITNLSWNSSVLNYVSDTEGTFLKSVGGTLYAAAPANNVNGILPEVSSTRLAATPTASGNGDLVAFTFQVVGYGSTNIAIGSATLQDSSQVVVSAATTGSVYTGLPPPPPYGPTAIITAPANNGFFVTGSAITLDGSASTGGFNGSATKPITGYSWTVSGVGTFSGATASIFAPSTPGDLTITLTVTAAGASPATNVATVVVHVVAPPSGPAIDVYTQRGGLLANVSSDAFGPQQLVNMSASVTYNNVPVVGKDVSFEVHDSTGALVDVRTARTDANGIATSSYRLPWPAVNPDSTFGTWMIIATVDISQVVVNDTVSFSFNYLLKTTVVATLTMTNAPASSFARDAQMQVSVTVQNIAQVAYTGKVCITICDEANVPIAVIQAGLPVNPSSTATTIQTLSIPHYAFVGQAKVYVDVLTQLPSLGGVPYSPEVSQPLAITQH